jgi:O-antigen ligase
MLETKAITYQYRWFQSPLLLLILAAVAGMFWLPGISGISMPLRLVLLAQVILFILLLRRPVWAMAALIVGQLTASTYMFPILGLPISVRFFWTILALFLLVPILMKNGGIKLGSRAWRVIIPAVILFYIATISNFINVDPSITVKYLRTVATALVILFLLPATVNDEKDLKLLALVALITCSVSAVFALMQHFSYLGLPLYELFEGTLRGDRVSGLSESPVQLGYNLPIVLLPMLALFFTKGINANIRKLLPLLALLIVVALYFTFTRSGIYSLALGLVFIFFLMKGKYKKVFFLVALVLFGAFFCYVSAVDNRYAQGFSDESSAAGRLVLFQAGLNIALDNPVLGIGTDRFKEVSSEYASTINPGLMETQWAGSNLGSQEAHDDFIAIWASFGTLALLAFLWLFVGIFRNFLDAYRHSQTRFLKGFTLGCIGVVAAYIVNAAFHNVMYSSMLIWVLGGLSIASIKLASSQPVEKGRYDERP